jgi:uncharacterized protein YegJ (DUF2314 family)
VIAVVVLGLEVVKHLARREEAARQKANDKESDGEDEPIRSLVFLLSEAREVEPNGSWVKQLGDVLGQPLNAGGNDSKAFVIPVPHPGIEAGSGECFMLKIREGAFWILNMQKPYMDDPDSFAASIFDARLRTAIARHEAWISVDLVGWEGTFDRQAVYAVIGKALSVLAGPDVVAIYCPELQRCNEFDPALIAKLAGGNPLDVFEDSTFAPVITIDDEDEQLEAAKEEARRRWPEFVALFKSRDVSKELPFILKAPFSDKSKTEFMWMEVIALDDELVTGTLANTPHELVGFREGQTVTVPAGAIVDWMCLGEDGKPLGGWTNEVLARHAKRRK